MKHIENTTLWIVFKQWPQTGKIEDESAWFSEDKARDHARELVGKDSALIGLRSVKVNDSQSVVEEK